MRCRTHRHVASNFARRGTCLPLSPSGLPSVAASARATHPPVRVAPGGQAHRGPAPGVLPGAAHLGAGVDPLARRWAVALLAVDVVGLPVLTWATPWHWSVVVLVWASAVALLLVCGVMHHHRVSTNPARSSAETQQRLSVPTGPATAPPSAPRAGLAF